MTGNRRWVPRSGGEHCPSCIALAISLRQPSRADGAGVHAPEAWQAAHLWPKSYRLYCGESCQCTLVASRDPERGRIDAAPLYPKDETMTPLSAPSVEEEHRSALALTGEPNALGEFEILAISAGKGNGWTFTEECLKASLSLWDKVETFIDHGGWFDTSRSLRDLAGLCYAPAWDAERAGVKLQLRSLGPSGPLLSALAKEMLADQTGKPRVGFSADVIFTAGSDRVVKNILRVLSLDLVFNPARGGVFLRALQSVGAPTGAPVGALETTPKADHRRETNMAEHENASSAANGQVQAPAADSTHAQLARDREAVAQLLHVQQEQAALAAEADKARAVRAQMCAYLLDSGLAASRLPAAAQDFVRAAFKDKVFEPGELTAAIDAQRVLVASLTAGAAVAGPGRVSAMLNTRDKLQAALDDLLGAPREPALASAQVARLSGIRELYLMLTGDADLHGGYHPEHAALATTADFTGLVTDSMNKIVAQRWSQLGRAGYDWWRKISVVEHFNALHTITGTLIGTVGTLPSVAEGAEYTELAVGDSPETASFTKYGGYIPLTLELIDRDDARKLAAYPRELANAGLRRISALVAAIFTANSAVGPTLADGGALFNNTAVTTAGGHLNLLTTALSGAEWEVVSAAVYNQPMLIKNATGLYGTGPKMAINPRYCLVPRALQLTAKQILYPSLERATDIYTENQQRGEPGDVVTVPEWTDATDWAAVCDPDVAPAIYVGERFGILPEIFVAGDSLSPAVFMNDEHRIKVRHFLAVWVNDFRPLHKSNV